MKNQFFAPSCETYSENQKTEEQEDDIESIISVFDVVTKKIVL